MNKKLRAVIAHLKGLEAAVDSTGWKLEGPGRTRDVLELTALELKTTRKRLEDEDYALARWGRGEV